MYHKDSIREEEPLCLVIKEFYRKWTLHNYGSSWGKEDVEGVIGASERKSLPPTRNTGVGDNLRLTGKSKKPNTIHCKGTTC